MPYYESVFIARQDISATQANGLADAFAEIVTENGGQVTKREYWGLKNLAYRIKKNRKGHYTLFNLDAPWAAVQEMERNMRLNEDVMRYLTIRVDELEEGPSAMMQGRGSRDDRRGRGGRDGDRGGREGRRARGDRRDDDKPKAADSKAESKTESKRESKPEAKGDEPKAEAKGDEPKAEAKSDEPKAETAASDGDKE